MSSTSYSDYTKRCSPGSRQGSGDSADTAIYITLGILGISMREGRAHGKTSVRDDDKSYGSALLGLRTFSPYVHTHKLLTEMLVYMVKIH